LEVPLKTIALATTAGLAALLATAFPNWVELVTGFDPDGRNGSIEFLIAAGLLTVVALTFALAATKKSVRVIKRFH
jgi:hypothetical protein